MGRESSTLSKILTNATATGVGSTVVDNLELFDIHCMEIVFTNAGGFCTALTVTLEGSLTGNNWSTIATKTFTGAELTAKTAMHTAINTVARFVRCNVTVLTDTGTTTINVIYGGRQA